MSYNIPTDHHQSGSIKAAAVTQQQGFHMKEASERINVRDALTTIETDLHLSLERIEDFGLKLNGDADAPVASTSHAIEFPSDAVVDRITRIKLLAKRINSALSNLETI